MGRINSIRTSWQLPNPIDLSSLVLRPQRSFTLVSVKSQKRSYSLDSQFSTFLFSMHLCVWLSKTFFVPSFNIA
jgi:hypothetical protein